MKKLILSLGVLSLLLSCGDADTENTMTVTGNVKGLKKGTLYLQHLPDSTLVTLDSLEIAGDGNFEFKTELESPEVFYLYLNKKDNNDINDRITFFGEPGIISIKTSWDTFDTKAKIEGSSTHKKLEEYRKVMTRFNTQNLEILRAASDPKIRQDTLAMDSIQKASDKNMLRGYLYALNFALNNKDSHIAPYIAITEVADAKAKLLDSIYNALIPEVAASKYGKRLKQHLEEIKLQENGK
ncbi:DUF4369 domain-containing protein [Muriicola sp. Z0-33]|uniref:DUF4369 domain-containing protein n=1 Tax=Muriicola sp. Z0-33 TaxID=2816957 RepID=UPI00223887D7|nr:DUF4369 domain-containing protein [Muriicola sp. Z0-33]MCW5517406.1 DUF4369 domain-containing protein [Muriicola sp. Z0-33]